MKVTLLLCLTAIFISTTHIDAQNLIVNNVADAGVIKYDGNYYIGGVGTAGSVYISENLTNWSGPIHIFSMDNKWANGIASKDFQIHANDFRYINGVFHLYWSVNWWGKDNHTVRIGHAFSKNITGPYTEPEKERWLESRIDPMVFKDDNGSLYLYYVKFTDGNTIWARKMSSPCTFSGRPIYQFASLPDTWETTDNKVAEGPWVIKYREKYYMLYNANHTSPEWGNYQIGAAVADRPDGFDNGGKQSAPVMTSNQLELENNFRNILISSDIYDPIFKSSQKDTSQNWIYPSFNDTGWENSLGGFGTQVIQGSTTKPVSKLWTGDTLFIRKHFVISEPEKIQSLSLRLLNDSPVKVWLNGNIIYESNNPNYTHHMLDKSDISNLRKRDNILAIMGVRNHKNAWIDVSLFDMKGETASDIFFSPGQPNLIKGPNGFEWWLIYMADKNASGRNQYASRAYFSNGKIFTDPIAPSFGNEKVSLPIPSAPAYFSRDTTIKRKIDSAPSKTYLFETLMPEGKDNGIILLSNKQETIEMVLDNKSNACKVKSRKGKNYSFPLPYGFLNGSMHEISVIRNSELIKTSIDGIKIFEIKINDKINESLPGIFGETEKFGAISYTVGWDETDDEINGWKFDENSHIFSKGEADLNKDFSLTVNTEEKTTLYPIYNSREENISVTIDPANSSIKATVNDDNKTTEYKCSLTTNQTAYRDIKFSDFKENTYTFDSRTLTDRIMIPIKDVINHDYKKGNIFNILNHYCPVKMDK